MIYPASFETKLGFTAVRNRLCELCESNLGKEESSSFSFSNNSRYIRNRLGETNEMLDLISAGVDIPVVFYYNPESWLLELSIEGSHTSPLNYLRLRKTLEAFQEVRNFYCKSDGGEGEKTFIYPYLGLAMKNLSNFPEIIREIDSKIDKNGDVKDNASEVLLETRKALSSAQGQISRTISKVLASAIAGGIVERDSSPSMRDGRMVIPVVAAKKRLLSGIIHDESASGKTVFIEPSEVVEVSNHLRELQLAEQREIVRILTSLADFIRPEIDDILKSNLLLGRLDFITAKAKYAMEVGGSMPSIENGPEIDWYGAVHPVLLETLRAGNRQVVPLSLRLDRKTRFLIISGPNAGGKSVALKTVGIVQYMFQCGILPSLYSNSRMGVFRNIFIDIGDEQSIEDDLSTYSSHLLNMKFFLQNADRNTLILADEMGSGTEPQIGGALAQAILMELADRKCFGIVTTHYFNLKNFAETQEGFINGSMIYDRQLLKPTFQLAMGSPGSSYAIEIARKIGLSSKVVDNAKEIVGSDYIESEKYLAEINRDKKYWQSKRQNIKVKESKLDLLVSEYEKAVAELKNQKKKIIEHAREEADEILSSANARIENTISEIKAAAAEKEKTKEIRRELVDFKNKINHSPVDDELKELKAPKIRKKKIKSPSVALEEVAKKGELSPGDYVKINGASSVGQILSVSGKEAEVAFGNLRTKVKLKNLVAASKPNVASSPGYGLFSQQSGEQSRKRLLDFKGELDVRGMRGDDALNEVTHFIDDAVQFGASRVRILHGTGQGILRTLIRNLLACIPGVTDYRDEDVRYGGAGITVVTLK